MSGALAANVALIDPATGAPRVFVAGSTPPDWAVEQITNPKAWSTAPAAGDDDEHEGDGPPPKGGAGSGIDAWRTYATETLGLSISDDASREEIIEAVEAADGSGD